MPKSDLTWSLPADLASKVTARMADMRRQDVVRRIWARDMTVWTGADEDRWLGWLTLPAQDRSALSRVTRFAAEIKSEGVQDVVLLGMGGSSLAPEVIQSIVGRAEGYPRLHVLDSTDPGQILSIERAIDVRRTLFLVASKSGSTLEVNILKQYFFDRAVQKLGATEAGRRFALTTDPGSKMHDIAVREHFRDIFDGVPSVGGRYSALSNFGLVPAALIGIDVSAFLDSAEGMARRCASDGPENSAFELGVLLGELALHGRDKPTLIAPAGLAGFGVWLEQLVAESLGKEGKGILPIEGETPGTPDVYGRDRVFVHLRLAGAPDPETDAVVLSLERAGHPVIRIDWADRNALGAEFFRWEFATAVAGAILGVNPFDQPDVESTKVVTRRIASDYERTGSLPSNTRVADAASVGTLLNQLREGDYVALLAYIEMNQAHVDALQAIRMRVRDRKKVATSVGFGPRYLHSTGQGHKGGPNTGVFLMITCDDREDVSVPGQKYSFGTIKLAQALGDLEVLTSRGRRVIRVHLKDVEAGLRELAGSGNNILD
ncbi:MAG TPA: bifunctional transaldolase/phosoglucose isomerase [Vicinamibacterales bacterium]|nr:bifunctional transaldolase/phosoglucose isomerase [Vicinamibacterales bacterium]